MPQMDMNDEGSYREQLYHSYGTYQEQPSNTFTELSGQKLSARPSRNTFPPAFRLWFAVISLILWIGCFSGMVIGIVATYYTMIGRIVFVFLVLGMLIFTILVFVLNAYFNRKS